MVCKQGVSVGLVPLKLLGECVIFWLVEEVVAVLPEGFKEIHPYNALYLVHDSCGVPCGTVSIHPFPMYPLAIMFTPIII